MCSDRLSVYHHMKKVLEDMELFKFVVCAISGNGVLTPNAPEGQAKMSSSVGQLLGSRTGPGVGVGEPGGRGENTRPSCDK